MLELGSQSARLIVNLSLTTHTPLIKGVTVHPLIKGVGLKKHSKIRGFGQPTPLIKEVNLHPLN